MSTCGSMPQARACRAWARPISPPFRRHEGIERHVLGLEGRDAQALARQEPAEGGGDGALAGMRGGAEDHDGLGTVHRSGDFAINGFFLGQFCLGQFFFGHVGGSN